MHIKDISKSGNPKTLFSAFLYFDMSFMIWVILGALGNSIAEEFHLSAGQKGLMIGLSLTFIPLLLGGLATNSFGMVLVVALLLGIAGASFAVALPMASRWYPPEKQGLVMGIAGAGNSGTVLASLFAPQLVVLLGGWRPVMLVAMIPAALVWVFMTFAAKEAPGKPPARTFAQYVAVLRQRDTLWFCILYSVTFGGFVGLSTYL